MARHEGTDTSVHFLEGVLGSGRHRLGAGRFDKRRQVSLELVEPELFGRPDPAKTGGVVVLEPRLDLRGRKQQGALGEQEPDRVLNRVDVPHEIMCDDEVEHGADLGRLRPRRKRQP